jgi:sulfane dehydrogenase subunit SoxC
VRRAAADPHLAGGATWADAELGPVVEQHCWRAWQWTWNADAPGKLEICVRATDAAGNTQPVAQPWNRQGMANNHVQRVPVLVR